jgi:hypothetical protein
MHDSFRYLVQAMQQSPHDKSPTCAMPKPAYKKNDQYIKQMPPFFTSASSQRKIDVITQPRTQADMPSAPEFSD